MGLTGTDAPAFETPPMERGLFAELFGFVIADPVVLERFHGRPITGTNLLERYTQTDEGEWVAEAGAAIPVLGVEAGYYSVAIRHCSAPTQLRADPIATSAGRVLEVASGTVVVCGIGYLTNWNPQHEAVRHVAIPAGWYAAEIVVGPSMTADDFLLEIILTPLAEKPAFSGDLSAQLMDA